jgi:phage-related tail protein
MPEPKESASGVLPPLTDEDRAIHERARDLTSQVLQQGRLDTNAVRDIVRAVTGQTTSEPAPTENEARESFPAAVRALDEALVKSASFTHEAVQKLASRGNDFTENDLKEVLVRLRKLEEDYVALASFVAEAMTGNLRREMMELVSHAQGVGTEASARMAGMMSDFASRMGEGATSGLETMRGTGMRMALLASGVLAGVADALRERPELKKGE